MQYIQIFLSFQCNYNCNFCFNRDINNEAIINHSKFAFISSVLKNSGVREIDILGGEPLIHDEIIDILEIGANNFDSIFLSTNGSAIKRLRDIGRLFPDVKIGISINSKPSEELKEYILRYRPVLKSVAACNCFIPDTALKFIEDGLTYYLIYRDVLSEKDLRYTMPFYEFLKAYERWSQVYPNLKAVYCGGFIADDNTGWRCPAGSTKLSIMPDGSVFPCYLLFRFPEFRLGNIFDTAFEDILRNPILDFFRKKTENNCAIKTCHIKNQCNGGCPAVSYSLFGDIAKTDPRCNIIKRSKCDRVKVSTRCRGLRKSVFWNL